MKKTATVKLPEGLEYEEATRKPFPVVAVQVTMSNVELLAKWCKGAVSTDTVRLAGAPVELPCVLVPGTGVNKGSNISAVVGMYVVEHHGAFRAYRADQYTSTFDRKPKAPRVFFELGDKVIVGHKIGEIANFEDGKLIVDFEQGDQQAFAVEDVQHFTGFTKGDWVRVCNKSSDYFGRVGQVYEMAHAVTEGQDDGLFGVDFGSKLYANLNSTAPFYLTELEHFGGNTPQ